MQLFTISYLFFIFDQPENSFFFCHHLEYATFYNFVFTFFYFLTNLKAPFIFLSSFKICNFLQFCPYFYYYLKCAIFCNFVLLYTTSFVFVIIPITSISWLIILLSFKQQITYTPSPTSCLPWSQVQRHTTLQSATS